ncbi:hypothetical protein ACLOJK_025602 [Asimina triloba]
MQLPMFLLLISSLLFLPPTQAQPFITDLQAMLSLRRSIINAEAALNWTHINPCMWPHVACSCNPSRIIRIQINGHKLSGALPPDIRNLTNLRHLELQSNRLAGPLPSFKHMIHLQALHLHDNLFTFIPPDFFAGLHLLSAVSLDNNPFASWGIPDSLQDAKKLTQFTASSANVAGEIPEFFGAFQLLSRLSLSFNSLRGSIPAALSASPMSSLWLNDQQGNGLSGSIDIIANMTSLVELWLHSNDFSGPLPDIPTLRSLKDLKLHNNRFTGVVPNSLINLPSLRRVTLANNLLQGPLPVFPKMVETDEKQSMTSNHFCLSSPGNCDPRVEVLLLIAEKLNYPMKLSYDWRGNDPCDDWAGIRCEGGSITIVNLSRMGFSGRISPDFAMLKSLQILVLSDNKLTGSVPIDIAGLPRLILVDVRNNLLSGKVPHFDENVEVFTDGNPGIIEETNRDSSNSRRCLILMGIVVGSVVCVVCVFLILWLLRFHFCKRNIEPIGVEDHSLNAAADVTHLQFVVTSSPDSMKIAVAS